MISKKIKNNINKWLEDEANTWFYNLDESEKLDIIEGIYPNEVGLIDSDELWLRTDFEIKLKVWKENLG